MATSGQTLTVQDLNEVKPVLRLRLSNKAETLAAEKPAQPGFMEKSKKWAENMFWKAETGLNLETETTKEAMERNKEKVDKIFDSMVGKINKQRENVKKELESLTPQQQEDVIDFWGTVQQFFMDLFQWVKDVFTHVIDKIRAGWRIVKDAVKGLFDSVMNWVKMIF
jgi:hypothetical protein